MTGLYDEIERVLFDYPAMRINLANLADAEDSWDFSLDSVRVMGGDMTSRVERLAVRRADYARYISVVDAVMAIMPKDERQFIELRYFQGRSMEDVAEALHVGDRTAFRMRERVLDRFAIALGWGRRHRRFMRPVQVQGVFWGA
ncbi:MAG TPA: hypothetical protein GXX28_10670 [Firmicutes bacterium]|nr:hypothetical protein [Bacillota bacterium]